MASFLMEMLLGMLLFPLLHESAEVRKDALLIDESGYG